MHIPFVNLRLQYESIQYEIDEAIKEVFSKAHFIGGETVSTFEEEFASVFSIKHCIGTGNGTDSLYIILKTLGVGPGDEVITPAFSCIASAEIISQAGAEPVFADVHPELYTLDVEKLEEKITPKTKAIIAVHLYGQAAPVGRLKEVCDRFQLHLIEDCAQAHLTKEANKLVGTFGVAAAFSFYPTKNLGAYGDAGCVITNDDALAERIRRYANHGALHRNDHAFQGTNSRLDALQAAILSVKLKHLPRWNKKRIEIAEMYARQLKGIPQISIPAVKAGSVHTFHIYAIRSQMRDALKKYLLSKGVETLIHYPQGLPYTMAFNKHYHAKDFPVTYKIQDEVLSLPVYPELTPEEVEYTTECIKDFFRHKN